MSGVLLTASWGGIGAVIGTVLGVWTQRLVPTNTRYVWTPGVAAATWTATVFAVLAWRLSDQFDLAAYSYLAAIAVPLTMIDATQRRLPSVLVWPSLAVLTSLFAVSAIVHSTATGLVRALAALAVVAGFYLLLAVASGGGLGAGDVKLGGLLGLSLGWASWSAVLIGTLLGWLIGAVTWLALRLIRRTPPESALPMGPFLLLGAVLAVTLAPSS